MKTIYELDKENNYLTDKLGRDPINRHDYGASYEFHFSKYRNESIVFWEIGIQRGDSLRLWNDYFPKAKIVGIDKELPKKELEKRVFLCQGDATDSEFLMKVAKRFPPDIILDDGSHLASEMMATCQILFPVVKILYVVEDIGTQYPESHNGSFLDAPPFTDYIHHECNELARLKENGISRICWEPGQVYLYK